MPANDPLAYVRDARAPMEPAPTPAPQMVPAPERAPADITALLDSMLAQKAPATMGARPSMRQGVRAAPNADVQRLQALKGDLAKKAEAQEAASNPLVDILQNKVRWIKKGQFIGISPDRIDVGEKAAKALGERHLPSQIPVMSLLDDAQYARFLKLAQASGIADEIPHVIDLRDLDEKQLATVMKVRASRNVEAAQRIEEEEKKKGVRRGR